MSYFGPSTHGRSPLSQRQATWVYQRTEPMLWTVGYYDPSGGWHTDSDHDSREDAARRVRWLNGGSSEELDSSDEPEI